MICSILSARVASCPLPQGVPLGASSLGALELDSRLRHSRARTSYAADPMRSISASKLAVPGCIGPGEKWQSWMEGAGVGYLQPGSSRAQHSRRQHRTQDSTLWRERPSTTAHAVSLTQNPDRNIAHSHDTRGEGTRPRRGQSRLCHVERKRIPGARGQEKGRRKRPPMRPCRHSALPLPTLPRAQSEPDIA